MKSSEFGLETTDKVTDATQKALNPLSGHLYDGYFPVLKCNMTQIRQMAGMRGLMTNPFRQNHLDFPIKFKASVKVERFGILHLYPRRT